MITDARELVGVNPVLFIKTVNALIGHICTGDPNPYLLYVAEPTVAWSRIELYQLCLISADQ